MSDAFKVDRVERPCSFYIEHNTLDSIREHVYEGEVDEMLSDNRLQELTLYIDKESVAVA